MLLSSGWYSSQRSFEKQFRALNGFTLSNWAGPDRPRMKSRGVPYENQYDIYGFRIPRGWGSPKTPQVRTMP